MLSLKIEVLPTKLFIGTRRGIYIAGSASFNDEAITPSNFRVRLFEASGASRLQPVEGCDSIFFVDVSGKKVHEIHFSAETTTYQADNISLLSGDLTLSGITSHAWQQNPIQTYWCTVRDGYLCSLTYLKNNGIMAWAKHVIMSNNVKVEQLCTMHGDENDGELRVSRPKVSGSSGSDLISDIDLLGYMQMKGNVRTVCFSPTEKFYAKNSLELPETIEIPNNSNNNNAFQKLIENRVAERRILENQKRTEYDSLMEDVKDIDSLNEIYKRLNEYENIWDSGYLWRCDLKKRAEELNAIFDKDSKSFKEVA